MTEKEKRALGLEYDASDKEILREYYECKDKCFEFNNTKPSDLEGRRNILKTIFGKMGESVVIQSPFWCDFGYNIEVGNNFFANHGCTMLDTAKITFGDNVFIGPSCGFHAAIHPLDPEIRATWVETAKPIRVGNNVWFGAAVNVLPGVTIGDNVVIGAGSLVTSDIPDNVLAYGNPCRIIRRLRRHKKRTRNNSRELYLSSSLLPFPSPIHPERLPKTVAETKPFLLHMLPYYAHHEQTFERIHAIHGRGHIIRAWMLAATMSNICSQHGLTNDLCATLCAVIGHDCGRQDSGYDVWEADSATLTVRAMREYFGEDSMGESYEQAIRDCIEKRGGLNTLESLLEQGADSLDIARCANFKLDKFFFLRDDDCGIPDAQGIREELMHEAKHLLHLTYPPYDVLQKLHSSEYVVLADDEEAKAYERLWHEYRIPDSDLVQRYIQCVYEHKRMLPLISSVDFNG